MGICEGAKQILEVPPAHNNIIVYHKFPNYGKSIKPLGKIL